MADAELTSGAVRGRAITPTDHAVGLDPTEADASAAAKADTWAEVFLTLLRAFPTSLTETQRAAIRDALTISGRAPVQGTPPSNPQEGDPWWDTTGDPDAGLKIYVGGAWQAVGAGDEDDEGVVDTLLDGTEFASGAGFYYAPNGAPTDDNYDLFIISTRRGTAATNTTFITGAKLRAQAPVTAGQTVTTSNGLPINTIAGYARIGRTSDGAILVGERLGVQPALAPFVVLGIRVGGARGPAGAGGTGDGSAQPDLSAAVEKLIARTSPIHDRGVETTFAQPQNVEVGVINHGDFSLADLDDDALYDAGSSTVGSSGSYGLVFRVPSSETVNNPRAVVTRAGRVVWRLGSGWADRGIAGTHRYYAHRGLGGANAVQGESLRTGDVITIEGSAVVTEVVPAWDGLIAPERILSGLLDATFNAATGVLTLATVGGTAHTASLGAAVVVGREGAILDAGLREADRRLDTLGITSAIGDFVDATASHLAEGFGFYGAGGLTDAPSVQSEPYVLPDGAPANGVGITPELQLPRGVNPARVRLIHFRGGVEVDRLPRPTNPGASEWRALPGLDVQQNRYTQRFNAVVSDELPLVVHDTFELRAGDTVRMQIAPETLAFAAGTGGTGAVLACEAALVSGDDHAFVEGTWVEVSVADSFALNVGGFTVNEGRLIVPAGGGGVYDLAAAAEAHRSATENGSGGRTSLLCRIGMERGGVTTWFTRGRGVGYVRGAGTSNLGKPTAQAKRTLAGGDQILVQVSVEGASQTLDIDGAHSWISAVRLGSASPAPQAAEDEGPLEQDAGAVTQHHAAWGGGYNPLDDSSPFGPTGLEFEIVTPPDAAGLGFDATGSRIKLQSHDYLRGQLFWRDADGVADPRRILMQTTIAVPDGSYYAFVLGLATNNPPQTAGDPYNRGWQNHDRGIVLGFSNQASGTNVAVMDCQDTIPLTDDAFWGSYRAPAASGSWAVPDGLDGVSVNGSELRLRSPWLFHATARQAISVETFGRFLRIYYSTILLGTWTWSPSAYPFRATRPRGEYYLIRGAAGVRNHVDGVQVSPTLYVAEFAVSPARRESASIPRFL